MEEILKFKCSESDNARLTRTYLVITISKDGQFSESQHEFVGYFSLSSYYVFERRDNSDDITLGPGDIIINTKIKDLTLLFEDEKELLMLTSTTFVILDTVYLL